MNQRQRPITNLSLKFDDDILITGSQHIIDNKLSIVNNQEKQSNEALKKEPKKCQFESCKTKLGLATRFVCRCHNHYCTEHRQAEKHNCNFDYKTLGKNLLEKANVKVIASKIEEI